MPVTLRDVAELAGVSVKTVSNVVNGYSFVKEENRRRVQEALAVTGYRPNLGARNLRRGRTGFIALVVPELTIPYFSELASLVIAAARRHDWAVLIEQTQGSRSQERLTLRRLGTHLVDGALVGPEALQRADFEQADPALPMVLLGEHGVELALDRVAIDNVRAAREAVEHLIATGRRRIGVIGVNPSRGTSQQRLTGYRQALAAAGLVEHPSWIVGANSYHRPDGAAAMRALLAGPAAVDAVFCFNDLLAVGALRAAVEHGLRVPQDVAIVGFDDIEDTAYSVPSLTTVSPDKKALADAAVDLLQERVATKGSDGADPGGRTVDIPFELVVRESSAPAG